MSKESTAKGLRCLKGSVAALLLAASAAAQAASYDFSATNSWTSYGGETQSVTLYYKILTTEAGDSVEVVSGDGAYSDSTIVIPDSVKYTLDGEEKTYFVESIDAGAFSSNSALKEVTIPKYVTAIGNEAFNGCENLETVVFNAEKCGRAFNIFSGCDALSTLTFGETVMAVPDNLMSKVSSENDYYSNTNKTDTAAVTNFPNLKEIDIPDNVIYIGTYAFAMNKGLETLTIGAGVLYILQDAFADCPNLATVNYNAASCSSEGYHGNAMEYCAFWNDTNLSTFTIADGVTSIPDYLLYGEYSHGFPLLTALTIPSSVTSIGEKAFSHCTSLAALTLADGTETLAITTSSSATAFDSCPIATLYLGRNLSYTDQYSPFRDNATLTSLTIGDEVTSIGQYAFYQCTGFTSLTIPVKVTYIGGECFNGCKGITTINYNAENCSSSGWMGSNGEAWSNIFYGAPLQHFYFGDTVETIPQYLVNGQYSRYENLTEVTIPASVKTIETHAFNYTDIKTVYCLGSTPATCNSDSFSDTRVTDTWLVVPEDAAINYGGSFQATVPTATGWSVLNNLREAQISISTDVVSEHYATCYSPYEYTLAEGLEAAVITGMSNENTKDENGNKVIGLSMNWAYGHGDNQTPVVPAGTAVLMRNTEGTTDVSFVNETENTTSSLTSVSGNVLYGTTTLNEGETITTTVGDGTNDNDYYFYKFTYGASEPYTSTLGFYWMADDGAPFSLPKKKIWLALPKTEVDNASFDTDANTASIPLFTYIDDDADSNIDEENAATGIAPLAADVAGGKVVYNLAGQRVNGVSRKGVYIVGGKKYVKN
ncbi:MAG: leucine-rich repeat domain-containing protein [Prevotella sp.]|nr:leucine-rich repeat domain-containing protein [Prevotella sp.]